MNRSPDPVVTTPAPGKNSLISLPRPPILAATDAETLQLARLTAARTRWTEIYGRNAANRISIEALPFLYRTKEGRQFLDASGPRALSRGMPADICPVTVTTIADGAVTLPDLAEQNISACIALVKPDHPDCGCRLLAIGDYLTVPPDEMNYATGTSARLSIRSLGIDTLLVAEEVEDGSTLLRDLTGTVARITRPAPSQVVLTLASGSGVFTGRSQPVGYRRGRIVERILAADPSGARATLLIGFEPDELARRAAELAKPADG